ncbi:MAG: DNA-binding protein [Planctomycetota bacterium]
MGRHSKEQTGRYVVAGRQVVCPHCGHDEFEASKSQLNTAGMSFLGLDWANKSAHILICTACSRIEWFGQAPEEE